MASRAVAIPPGFELEASTDANASPAIPPGFELEGKSPSTGWDMAKSAGIGLAKGAIGLAGLPGDINSALKRGNAWAAEAFPSIARKRGEDENFLPAPPTSADIQRRVERETGPFYQPQTTPGRFAQTAGEFVPAMMAGPGGLARRAATGAVAGAASEGAGQAFDGGPWEGAARVAGGLVGGGLTAAATAPRTAASAIRAQLPSYVDDAAINQADALVKEAARRGVRLTWPEALSHVTGRPVLNDLQRQLEATSRTRATMGEFLGDRPERVASAARTEVGNIAPTAGRPSSIGPAVGEAAEGDINSVREDINRQAKPYYDAASAHTLTPTEMAALHDEAPGLAGAIERVRRDPQLNRYVAHLPDTSVGVLNEASKFLQTASENAASPVQQGRNAQRSVGLGMDAAAVKRALSASESKPPVTAAATLAPFGLPAAPTTAGATSGNYARALTTESSGRGQFLDPLLEGPLGKLADKDIDTKKAISALFPAEPVAGSAREVGDAVSRLAARNPTAARQLVRAHVEQKLNEAFDAAGRTREAAGFSGAGFAQRLTGSPIVGTQRGENFKSAVEALPDGKQVYAGVSRLLEVMRATGERQAIGSKTAYNAIEDTAMHHGNHLMNIGAKALSPGSWMHAAEEMWGKWIAGKNLDALAKMITDPKAAATFRKIAAMPRNSGGILDGAARITAAVAVPEVRRQEQGGSTTSLP